MKALLTAVQAAVNGLVGTTAFDDPACGTHVMRYYLGEMPDKREVAANGEDFPYCLVALGEIVLSRDGRSQEAVIKLGLYEAGSKSDALTMIDSVLTLVADLANQKYAGYRLLGEFSGNYEADYPYYEITLTGEFKKVR